MRNFIADPLPLSYKYSDGWVRTGWISSCSPSALNVRMRGISAGSIIEADANGRAVHAEVRSVNGDDAICTPLSSVAELTVGARATSRRAVLSAYCGEQMLGHCVDAWGRSERQRACAIAAPMLQQLALDERRSITRPLRTGIAAIDALCTIGVGQRVALFSGAGVGKSTLLRQIAERCSLDSHVIALIGERAREATEAVAALRQSTSWPRTTVVCATAGASPRERFAAARTALAQAEWLCERGDDVLLTVDSLTRVANAWRELALPAGEPPAHRGHPVSMIGALAGIVERAGQRAKGSITGIFAVLVDGDDPFEPVTDAVRALLDGHIVLSRRLADSGRFPPIDVLRSSSRLMHLLASRDHLRDAAIVRRALATLERSEDLFAIGAYKPGGDPWLDAVVAERDRLDEFIFHGQPSEVDSVTLLHEIASAILSHP